MPSRVVAHALNVSASTVMRSSHHRQMIAAPEPKQGTLTVLHGERLLKLAFPAKSMPGVGRSVAFDDVYGIMLVFARGRLWVVQY